MAHQARDHFGGLDALRGIAALLVVGAHACNLSGSAAASALASRAAISVDLFFMLSGFVLASAYEARLLDGSIGPLGYFRKRLARLYPMVAAGLILSLIDCLVFPSRPDWPALLALQAVLMPWISTGGAMFAINPPHWSLFYEVTVNMAHAVAARWLRTPVLLLVCGIAGMGFAIAFRHAGFTIGWSGGTLGSGLARVAFGFGVGVLLHRAWRNGRWPLFSRNGWMAVPLFLGVVASGGIVQSRHLDLLALFVVLPAVVWLAVPMQLAGARTRRLADLAARLSYPLYATHYPVLLLALHLSRAHTVAARTATLAAAVLVSITIAWVLETKERPWKQGLRRLAGKILRRRPFTAAAAVNPRAALADQL